MIYDLLHANRSKHKVSNSSDDETSEDEKVKEEEEEREEEEEDEEDMWVEKKVQQEGEGAYVGPVQEIKVQALSTKKE